MSWVDVAIVVIIGLSFVFGLWRGLIREVLSIVSWVAAIFIALNFSDDLALLLSGMIDSESIRHVVAFALLIIGTLVLGGILIHFISKLINFAGLKLTDRLLGSLFGIARGVLIVMALIFFAEPFFESTTWWTQSQFVPYGVDLIEWVRPWFDDSSVATS